MSGAHIPLPRSLWLRLLTRCFRSGLADALTRTFVPIELLWLPKTPSDLKTQRFRSLLEESRWAPVPLSCNLS
jgi:hypothetical protein